MSESKPLSPIIKIAPSKAEKAEQKTWDKTVDMLASEPSTETSKGYVSKRNEDFFINGPLNNQVCTHQPNGPEQDWDPGNHWGDYYIFEKMRIGGPFTPKRRGYHVYSSSRGLAAALEHKEHHKEHSKPWAVNIGSRTALNRKCYYYCGWIEEGLLAADGIYISDFRGILTLS